MGKGTILGGIACVIAIVALALGGLAFLQAQDANTKADNLIATLEDEQIFGVPMSDDGSVDQAALEELLMQQQQQIDPEQQEQLEEEMEQMEEQDDTEQEEE